MTRTSLPLSLSSSFYQESKSPPAPTFTHSPDYITLSRLLTRLSHHILSNNVDGDPTSSLTNPRTLRKSSIQRTRTLSNIEYGRALLLKLEQAAQGIKIQSQKKAVLKDLADKRRTIKKLRTRVEELAREGEANDGDTSTEESEAEDYFPNHRSETTDSASKSSANPEPQQKTSDQREPSATTRPPNQPATERDQLLRRRPPKSSSQPSDTAQTSGFSHLPTTESHLTTSSLTHESLTTSLASLATDLKNRQLALQQGIESDKSLLSRATEGLDRNLGGMEAAGRRMGVLRKMSEGKGWWGRMMLYAWIVGLWVVAGLLVFVGPKLRF
ncbi:MAG: hypothetical protein Q9227_006987 [Pyrenula ochraceoflavens]